MLHIPIVHAHNVSKQIEKKIFLRVENVVKQLVHTSAMRSSRYEAIGKFGEHERCVRVARGAAESKSSFLSEPIVLQHFQPDGNFFLEGFVC